MVLGAYLWHTEKLDRTHLHHLLMWGGYFLRIEWLRKTVGKAEEVQKLRCVKPATSCDLTPIMPGGAADALSNQSI